MGRAKDLKEAGHVEYDVSMRSGLWKGPLLMETIQLSPFGFCFTLKLRDLSEIYLAQTEPR